jgi:DNA-binding response OmpR family regulator
MKILLIEDEKETALTIKEKLKNDYQIDLAFRGEKGEELALINNYDIIIVDLMLPDKNGLEICQDLRKERINAPILILTGEGSIKKKVLALDGGADDYLTKPFSFAELKARIKALTRRNKRDYSQLLIVGDLLLDLEKRIARRGNRLIPLRRKEIALLEYLMRNPGRVLTRDMILCNVWSEGEEPLYNTVDVHIKYLRDRIDKNCHQKMIKTIYGLGYKLENQRKGVKKGI